MASFSKGDMAFSSAKSSAMDYFDDAALSESSDADEDDMDLDTNMKMAEAEMDEVGLEMAPVEEEEPEEPLDIMMRADFNPLALFSPSVPIDANGKASIPIKIPDNLTRYRSVPLHPFPLHFSFFWFFYLEFGPLLLERTLSSKNLASERELSLPNCHSSFARRHLDS